MAQMVNTAEGVVTSQTTVQPEWKRVSWGAIIAGAVIALVTLIALNLLGLAFGFAAVDPATDENPLGGIGIAAGIWVGISTILAMLAGGWTAGRMSAVADETNGFLHGVVTWAAVTLVSFFFITSTMSGLVSMAMGVMGTGLEMVGRGAAELVPEAAKRIETAAERRDVTLKGVIDEAREMLRQTGKPALQPEALERRAERAADAAQAEARDVARTPGDADRDAQQLLNRLGSIAERPLEAVDKEAMVNVIVARTDMSQQEAAAVVDRWEREFQQAAQALEEEREELERTALKVSEQVTDSLAAASFWTLLAMILGLMAAGFGGSWGTRGDFTVITTRRKPV